MSKQTFWPIKQIYTLIGRKEGNPRAMFFMVVMMAENKAGLRVPFVMARSLN
jgi:hypothetical protein